MSDPLEPSPPPSLPVPVRQRLVALAARALGDLPADQVPAALRAVARFAPVRRAKAGASVLATAVETDPLFRQRVTLTVREQLPGLLEALEAGTPPAGADPVDVAVAAYLGRPNGWEETVQAAAVELAAAGAAKEVASLEATAARLSGDLTQLRSEQAASLSAALAEAAAHRADAAQARRRLRESDAEIGRMRLAAQTLRASVESSRQEAATRQSTADAEVRRLKNRLADAQTALETARRASREGRSAHQIRLRLLLDTLLGAANGLRQELALPPIATRPADQVAEVSPAAGPTTPISARGHSALDPALVDQLLELPGVHLVVDGYNVTKSGYGALSLADQRTRLLTGLAALAARTRIEVTCVFDGAALEAPPPASAPRGVRVMFSPPGQTADELIDRIVRAEPPGRPVVVVSTDGEVAANAEAAGARAVPSLALLRRLDRA